MTAAPAAPPRPGRLRRSGLLPTLGMTAVVALPALALGPRVGVVLRALLWAAAGAALLVRARARPEPTDAIRLLGASDLLVGVAWGAAAFGASPDAPGTDDLWLLVAGIAGIGVATLAATPTWRHRTSLLDGVVGACAGAAVVVAVADGGADAAAVTAEVMAFAALLGPTAMLASLLSRTLQPTVGSWLPALGTAAVLHAGVATATAALGGGSIGPAAQVSWLLAAASGFVLAGRTTPSYRAAPAPDVGRPSSTRLLVLAALVLVPAAVGALAEPARPVAGLVLSLVAALVLVARTAATARLDVEDAQAAADVRFDALVEHAAEVLALLDGDGRLFYISRAVEETFHVPQDLVLGTSPAQLAHPEDVQDVEDLLGRVREQPGTPLHARLRLLDGRGASRHVDVTVVDLRHVPGVNAISLTVRDVTERVTLEAELVRQARTDGLTGLVTRTVLIERVDHVLTARRPAAALLFLDLDDFKLVNDGYGHAAGDEVLAVLASRLHGVLREHDTAGRMGGDEFAVLLEELADDPVQDAVRTARRLVEQVTSGPVLVDGEPIEIRLSVGVAVPDGEMTGAELFAAADAAMYEAKRERRGIVVFEPGMRASTRSRLRLMRDVRDAIEDGTLAVSYQPIVAVRDGSLQGVEALLRWVHPTLGRITPDVVLDHAEAAGLTVELTDRLLATIGRDLRDWHAATGVRLGLALNLSAQQLAHVDPQRVLDELVGADDPRGLLTIEVTETSMLGDLAAAARVLQTFRDAGCHVAIDDFGTGYASIGYLRRLPLDKLKIDRDFIDGLTPETVEGSFAAVIQGLAAALDLTTVAEGVETEEQLAAVRVLGCELVQGFLVSEGLPMGDLIDWAAGSGRLSDRA